MKSFTRQTLENAGMGAIVILPPLLVIYAVYTFIISPIDRLGNTVIELLSGRVIPLVGFIFIFTILVLVGFFVRSNRGGWPMRKLKSKFPLFSLLIRGAQSGTIGLILRSRQTAAPNVIMAPYYRKNGPWPFIILRVFPTSNPENPIISGVFLDFPFIAKGGTINIKDTVFVDIPFDEVFLFAITSGAGLENFSRPPKEMILKEHINTERFQQFMKSSATK